MEQSWWEFVKIGFLRAERYYRIKLAAGHLPDGFRIQDLDLDIYGHEFITAFLEIVISSKDIVLSVTKSHTSDYFKNVLMVLWRDFISFFVTGDTFDINKIEGISAHQYDVTKPNNIYEDHLVSLFIKLAIYRWRYPFSNQGSKVIDLNEKLDDFIERLKLIRSGDTPTDLSLTDLVPSNEIDQKLFQISSLAFEMGRAAGKREGTKSISELGRKQLIANSDKQAEELLPILRELTVEHNVSTLQEVADKLNERRLLTKNGNIWNPTNVKILIERTNRLFPKDPIVLRKDTYFEGLRPVIDQIKQNGAKTLADIAHALNEEKIPSKQGKIWHASTVKLLLERIDKAENVKSMSVS